MVFLGEFRICNMFTIIIYKLTILYWDYSEFIDYPTEHVIHWEVFFPHIACSNGIVLYQWEHFKKMG